MPLDPLHHSKGHAPEGPLVAFGELPPDGDEVPLHVKDYFYRYFLNFPAQTVIVENSAPPADVTEAAHMILFDPNGDRPGFFPQRRATPRTG